MHALTAGPLLVLAQAGGEGGSLLGGFLPLLLIGVAFYFLLIRPQQRRAKAQRDLVSAVGAGDRVVTIGGIHGTVADIDEDTMRLEVAPGMIVTMTRAAIARRIVDADEGVVGSGELVADDDLSTEDAPGDDLEHRQAEQRKRDAE